MASFHDSPGGGSAGASAPIPSTDFTVAHLPAAQRHEAWLNRAWPSLSPVYEMRAIGEFNGSVISYALGDIDIWFPQVTEQSFLRTTRDARMAGHDQLSLFMGWRGHSAGEAGDRSYRRGAGDLMFTDLAQPDRQQGYSGDDGIALVIPRALAETILPPVATLHGLVVPAAKATLISSVFLGLRGSLGSLSQAAVPGLRRALLDLVAVTLADAGAAEAPGAAPRGTALALRARREIEVGLGSATLSIASLGRKLGVSRSTLHRAFQADGGAEAYIRNRRLAAVQAALRDPAEWRSIGDLADAFGFSDGAHLARLFKARYAMTPSEYRLSINS